MSDIELQCYLATLDNQLLDYYEENPEAARHDAREWLESRDSETPR